MDKKYIYLIVVLLILACLIAFGRILGSGFVGSDTYQYITGNNHIKEGLNAKSIYWAFTTSYFSYWHPLTWLSHMLDWSLFGANASGHHFVSLLLHIGSAVLLFLFLNKTTGSLWPSAFAAALFALHPLRVESVAWAAERKDVLSVFFGMATIYAYTYYAEKPKLSKYFLCLILFALALMSKPMLVTLPFVLLLIDYWPLGRWQEASVSARVAAPVNIVESGKKKSKHHKIDSTAEKKITASLSTTKDRNYLIGRLILEKIPFLFLAVATSIVTILVLKKIGVIATLQQTSFSERIMNAIVSYVAYLGKTSWPVDLAVFYPYAQIFPLWQVLSAAIILLGISTAVIYLARKAPFLAVGWFWYLGVLFPVIGVMQAGNQSMADRFTYFPSIGIAIMLSWGVFYLLPKVKLLKIILLPAAVIVLSVLTILTWRQCGYWKSGIELFSHALRSTNNNDDSHCNLGVALAAEGKNEEAIFHYLEAIKINPNNDEAHCNIGVALAAQGKNKEAIIHYLEAIRLNPDNDNAHYNLGVALAAQGKNEEATAHYLAAIKLNPDNDNAYYNRGVDLAAQGKNKEAIVQYRTAIEINPNNDKAHSNLGFALVSEGKNEEAIAHYLAAIKINPNGVLTYFNLAIAFEKQGKFEEAIARYREVLSINPDYFGAHINLGNILKMQSKNDEAIDHYQQALRTDPNNPGIYFNIGAALFSKGEIKKAAENFRQAVYLKPDFKEAREALKITSDMARQQKR